MNTDLNNKIFFIQTFQAKGLQLLMARYFWRGTQLSEGRYLQAI